jgi:hypothetical protein
VTIKTHKPEGNGASQLVQLMKIHGYNKDINIELGTVTAAPPALKVRLDNMTIDLEAEDLVIAERLTKRKEKITIRATNVTDTMSAVTVGANGSHIHDITALTLTQAEIEYLDELKVGDRVVVAEVDEGQTYIILDRAVFI